jgi:hypothetical protein
MAGYRLDFHGGIEELATVVLDLINVLANDGILKEEDLVKLASMSQSLSLKKL